MLYDVTLVLATVATGLIAGLFYAFTICVMLALRRTGDRVFIEVMQRINAAIQNGWFALAFLGAPVFLGVVLMLDWRAGRGFAPGVVAGGVLYVVTLLITFGANIPLNNRLDAAGQPDRMADGAVVRRRFEGPWVRWNLLRTLTSVAAFACLCWALLTVE
ncbi:anthrone oxygenase family protein [Nonomuraea sp. B12E4]|uniref:anthrone oxygenase family protein n=1 Tax=Nonomuraea sp. B12E4 TaxID=3153564 RepID=UPI00325C823D